MRWRAAIWNQIRIGCANARDKGTYSNKHTIRRAHLEAAMLDGLQHHLMDPGLTEISCKEYAEHMNRLAMDATASLTGMLAELAKTDIETKLKNVDAPTMLRRSAQRWLLGERTHREHTFLKIPI
ncbi:MAG: hypothetical protein AAGA21_23275 [Pseudomonadota bacterium]